MWLLLYIPYPGLAQLAEGFNTCKRIKRKIYKDNC